MLCPIKILVVSAKSILRETSKIRASEKNLLTQKLYTERAKFSNYVGAPFVKKRPKYLFLSRRDLDTVHWLIQRGGATTINQTLAIIVVGVQRAKVKHFTIVVLRRQAKVLMSLYKEN